MESTEIFESSVRSTEDIAGVFEYADNSGFFYLYFLRNKDDEKIQGAIPIAFGEVCFSEADIEILWNVEENLVALLIFGQLCAVFDVDRKVSYGGNVKNNSFDIPHEIKAAFANQGRRCD